MSDNLPAPLDPASAITAVLRSYQLALAPQSRWTYDKALRQLARLDGLATPADLLQKITTLPAPEGKVYVLTLRERLIGTGLSPATVNLRLAALRRLLGMAVDAGMIDWTIRLPKVAAAKVMDRTGPTEEEFARLLASATSPTEEAILRLLGDAGLRVGEVTSLRMRDVVQDATGAVLAVLVKAKGQRAGRERVPVASETAKAVAAILTGKLDAPLIPHEAWAVRRIVEEIGVRAGVPRKMSPHLLRHRTGTHAAKVTGGDTVAVAALLRHKSTSTAFAYYIDDKEKRAAETAALVEAPGRASEP